MNNVYPKLLLLLLSFFGHNLLNAQPTNDDPCGAQLLSVNSEGYYCPNPNTCGNMGATNTSGLPAPGCSSGNADVWYKFIATATAHRITKSNLVPAVAGTALNAGVAVYSSVAGVCTTVSEIACSTSGPMNLTGLTIGNTYFLRLWTANTTVNPYFTIDLCIGSNPAVPPNDACANAISLNDGNMHFNYTNNATESMPPVDCGWGPSATGALDVWYKVTAATTGVITVNGVGYESLMNMETYSSCATTIPLSCVDDAPLSLNINATAGSTYYIRVYGRDGSGYMGAQASGVPLPVKFVNLKGQIKEKSVCLSWFQDSSSFYNYAIERSMDGKHFEEIAYLPYSGVAGKVYTDDKPATSEVYYRIAGKLPITGETVYSNIVSMHFPATGTLLHLYPNPVHDALTIVLDKGQPEGILTLESMTGQVLQTIRTTNNHITINMHPYPAQLYFIRYKNGSISQTWKFIKEN